MVVAPEKSRQRRQHSRLKTTETTSEMYPNGAITNHHHNILSSSRKTGGIVSLRVEMFEDSFTSPSSFTTATTTTTKLDHPQKQSPSLLETPPSDDLYAEPNPTIGNRISRTDHHNQRQSPPSPPPPPPPPSPESIADEFDCIGSTLIESGVAYYGVGDYKKALKAFTMALKTQRVSIGDEHISIALTLGNLGAVYLKQGNLDDAEFVLLESLAMKRRLKPHLLVADTLNNLGNCANLRGHYTESLEYYREALRELRTKQLKQQQQQSGDHHCDHHWPNNTMIEWVNALFNLGRLESQQQSWESALLVLGEALRVSKDAHGVLHAFSAQTLDLIGYVQLRTYDLDLALTSITTALGIFRKLYGPLHVDVANSLVNVGIVREAQGELVDALNAYRAARDVYARLGVIVTHNNHIDNEEDHPNEGSGGSGECTATILQRSIAHVEYALSQQQKQNKDQNQDQNQKSSRLPQRPQHCIEEGQPITSTRTTRQLSKFRPSTPHASSSSPSRRSKSKKKSKSTSTRRSDRL